jgi:hypothetical protein
MFISEGSIIVIPICSPIISSYLSGSKIIGGLFIYRSKNPVFNLPSFLVKTSIVEYPIGFD